MPISATGNKACGPQRSGFTLVEVMLVMAMLALVAGAVMLALPSQTSVVRHESEMLAARLKAAATAAILGNRTIEAVIDQRGYSFAQRAAGGWQPVRQSALSGHEWPEDVRVLAGEAGSLRVRFDSVGTSTAARVLLVQDAARMMVSIDDAGQVRVGDDQPR